jgi:hypothetical protein
LSKQSTSRINDFWEDLGEPPPWPVSDDPLIVGLRCNGEDYHQSLYHFSFAPEYLQQLSDFHQRLPKWLSVGPRYGPLKRRKQVANMQMFLEDYWECIWRRYFTNEFIVFIGAKHLSNKGKPK